MLIVSSFCDHCLCPVHHWQVDTRDILFICGGAFVDLSRQVRHARTGAVDTALENVSLCFFPPA